MESPFEEELSKLLDELHTQRSKASGAAEEMEAISRTVTSKNKMIKATVDGQGKLTEIEFRGDRWRDLAPAELSAVVIEAVAGAQAMARESIIELASGFAPEGMNVAELFEGKLDMDALFPDFEKIRKSFNE